jgi:hypothetical protein
VHVDSFLIKKHYFILMDSCLHEQGVCAGCDEKYCPQWAKAALQRRFDRVIGPFRPQAWAVSFTRLLLA